MVKIKKKQKGRKIILQQGFCHWEEKGYHEVASEDQWGHLKEHMNELWLVLQVLTFDLETCSSWIPQERGWRLKNEEERERERKERKRVCFLFYFNVFFELNLRNECLMGIQKFPIPTLARHQIQSSFLLPCLGSIIFRTSFTPFKFIVFYLSFDQILDYLVVTSGCCNQGCCNQ